jgi:hypothetical protein
MILVEERERNAPTSGARVLTESYFHMHDSHEIVLGSYSALVIPVFLRKGAIRPFHVGNSGRDMPPGDPHLSDVDCRRW